MNAFNMKQTDRDLYIKHVFTTVAPHLDPLTTGFSLGLDHLWRRKLLSLSGLRRGDHVLDLCTGTGELARLLLRKVGPEGTVTGLDFVEEMLVLARRKIAPLPPNLTLVQGDARTLDFDSASFDAVTVSFGIRNVPETPRALREVERVLKPGGQFLCLELTRPTAPWFLPLYKFYTFRVMPRIAKLVIKSNDPYTYLPRSIDSFHTPEMFSALIEESGLTDVSVRPLSLGIATIYRARKK